MVPFFFNDKKRFWGKKTATIRIFWLCMVPFFWWKFGQQSENADNNQKILTTNWSTTSTIRKFWQQSENSDNNQKILTTIRKQTFWQQSENSDNNQTILTTSENSDNKLQQLQQSENSDNNQKILTTIRKFWQQSENPDHKLQQLQLSENSDNNQKILTTIRRFWQQSEDSDNNPKILTTLDNNFNNHSSRSATLTIIKFWQQLTTIRKFWQQSENSDKNQHLTKTDNNYQKIPIPINKYQKSKTSSQNVSYAKVGAASCSWGRRTITEWWWSIMTILYYSILNHQVGNSRRDDSSKVWGSGHWTLFRLSPQYAFLRTKK